MKILCICEGGNVRSGALAYQLKNLGIDALALGWRYNTLETLGMLAEWADYIILMQPWQNVVYSLPGFQAKIRVLDVGPDRWGSNTHPELHTIIQPHVAEWKDRGFQL